MTIIVVFHIIYLVYYSIISSSSFETTFQSDLRLIFMHNAPDSQLPRHGPVAYGPELEG